MIVYNQSREIYEAVTVSGLAKQVVSTFSDSVTSLQQPPKYDISSILNHIIIDGDCVLIDSNLIGYNPVTVAGVTTLTRYGKSGSPYYATIDNGVLTNYADANLDNQLDGGTDISNADVVVIDGVGLGLLHDAKMALDRIETIYQTLADTTPFESMVFAPGMAANSARLNQILAARTNNRDELITPLPAGASIQQVSFKTLTDRLYAELQLLTESVKSMTAQPTIVPGESGIARRLGLLQYQTKLSTYIAAVTRVYLVHYGIDLRFGKFDITSADDDSAELDNIYSAMDRGLISNDAAAKKVAAILGLDN